MFSLTGKTALVAGASRGIGLAIAQHMAAAGAHTILASRSMDKLKQQVEEINSKGQDARAMELDIADPNSVEALADALPPVDILVNVAGTNVRKRFEDYSRQEYDRLLETNLHGIFRLTQRVGVGMMERKQGGKVISIGSLMTLSGLPYLAVYAISKGGLGQLTRVLAAEWGRHNIQVNCIAPGFIVTDLNRDMWKQEKMVAWLRANQANPNVGQPDDIAPLAVFLASRGSDYITGQVIAVDGGYSTTSVWPYEP
jgi:NAD(P)-dependent dehydrogenase (short-subunit alcohol dehydrogenase family)